MLQQHVVVDLQSVLHGSHGPKSDAGTASLLGVTVRPFSRVVDVNEALDQSALLRTVSEPIREEAELVANGCARTLLLAIYGADKALFENFLRSTGSVFAPSASAGYHLADVNDHAGILVVPAFDGRCKVAERVVVVTDITPDGETRYLVKGYGGRVVPFGQFQKIVADLREPTNRATENPMETEFRTRMRNCSQTSELEVRGNEMESDTPTFRSPIRQELKPRCEGWDNYEDAMPRGFGEAEFSAGTQNQRVDYQFQYDWNKIEQRIVLFRNDNFEGQKPRPQEGDRYPTVKAGGPVLAQIEGVDHVEITGSRKQVGVKMRSTSPEVLGQHKYRNPHDATILRITTQDQAVHELWLTKTGAWMVLINPQHRTGYSTSAAAFGVGHSVDADFDVYSYRGADTGLHTSASGFADPQLVTSCGDAIPAGPFLKPAAGKLGAFSSVMTGLGNLITLQPVPGAMKHSNLLYWLGTGLKVATQGAIVGGATTLVNSMRKGAANTITGSRKAFSASSAGALLAWDQAQLLIYTTLAQELFTSILARLARHIPEGLKPEARDLKGFANQIGGGIVEFVRLEINLLVQLGIGLPRGHLGDHSMLASQSALTSLTNALAETYGGYAENHRALQVALDVLKFGYDMVARSVGNALPIRSVDTFIANFRDPRRRVND